MELTVQDKIAQLLWDRRYLAIPTEVECRDEHRTLVIRDPSIAERNLYLIIRDNEEKKAIEEGVPTEEDIMESAKSADLWTSKDELILQETDSYLSTLEEQLKNQKFQIKRKKIEEKITEAKSKRQEISLKLSNFKAQTAEYLAHEIATFHLMQKIVLDINHQPIWSTESHFLEDKKGYPNFVYFIARDILNENTWSNTEIRSVAKNPEWRMLWVLNRESLTDVFKKNLGELNVNQKLLVYWSRMYDSAFEGMDKPDADIIQDDDKFDNWLINKEDELKSEKTKSPTKDHSEVGQVLEGEYSEECICGVGPQKNVGLGLKKLHAPNCPFGRFRRYTREEKEAIAQQIHDRNSVKVRKMMQQEQNKISKNGLIEEQDLRKKKSRDIIGAKTNIIPIRKK